MGGAWLDTGTTDKCFQVPAKADNAGDVHRLPVLDISAIPRVMSSPFTNLSYCSTDR
jgi:hypothetical protein